jgi:hypothetical protein
MYLSIGLNECFQLPLPTSTQSIRTYQMWALRLLLSRQSQGAVWSNKLNDTGLRAVTGSADFSARVWDALTGLELHQFPHKHIVRTVDFAHQSNRIVTGGASCCPCGACAPSCEHDAHWLCCRRSAAKTCVTFQMPKKLSEALTSRMEDAAHAPSLSVPPSPRRAREAVARVRPGAVRCGAAAVCGCAGQGPVPRVDVARRAAALLRH